VTSNFETSDVSVLLALMKTRTLLTVSPNPAPLNASLTLTANVTLLTPNPYVLTGDVRFFDGFTVLGTASLVNGTATLIHDANYPWAREYTAVYLGDTRCYGSHSPPVGQMNYIPNVGVEPTPALPLHLEAVHPNPVLDGDVTIRFTLPTAETAQLELFDVRGRRLARHEVGSRGAGQHAVNLVTRRSLAPGVYLVRLAQGTDARVTRMVVLGGPSDGTP
jgi:hypothetical protein